LRARWAGCTRFRGSWEGRSAYVLNSLTVAPFRNRWTQSCRAS
jgi:hypothetical protein